MNGTVVAVCLLHMVHQIFYSLTHLLIHSCKCELIQLSWFCCSLSWTWSWFYSWHLLSCSQHCLWLKIVNSEQLIKVFALFCSDVFNFVWHHKLTFMNSAFLIVSFKHLISLWKWWWGVLGYRLQFLLVGIWTESETRGLGLYGPEPGLEPVDLDLQPMDLDLTILESEDLDSTWRKRTRTCHYGTWLYLCI